jgi:predicted O-linked N-acetylglucosamine transferase (SPINDLY family)
MQGQDSHCKKLEIGIALHREGRLAEASKSYLEVLSLDPNNFDALHLLGVIFYQSRQPGQAVELISKALIINATFETAHTNLGNALADLKRFDEAISSYDQAIALNPCHADAYYNRGIALQALRRFEDAIQSYTSAISLRPAYAEAYCNRGDILRELSRLDEALADHNEAIFLNSDHALFHNSRGVTLQKMGRLHEALSSYSKTIALRPDYAEAHLNNGIVLTDLNRLEEALASFQSAVSLKPGFAEAYNNLSVALEKLKRFEEALTVYDKAVSLKPDYATAHYNRGSALKELKRYEEALASYGQTISLKPEYAEAYSNRGWILHKLMRFDEALANYDQAITLKPDSAQAYANSGGTLRRMERHREAASRYERALELDPNYPFAKGMLLHEKMFCAEWDNIQTLIDEIDRDIISGKLSVVPFAWQGISHSQRSLQLCAEIFNKERFPAEEKYFPQVKSNRERIRVGYLSGEFRDQATSHLLVGLIEQHDRSRFDIHILDNGWDDGSDIRKRIDKTESTFLNITHLQDRAAATIIQSSGIDILVNLNGYFGEERTAIFAQRPSPIQVNYLGFPGTLGADYIDYIVADRCVLPERHKQFYNEKVVYLPHCYQANDNKKRISDRTFTRAEFDLPEEAFVYCCFNNVYKITPDTFSAWMRILKKVEGGVLWLLDTRAANENLKNAAASCGVEPNQIIFAPHLSLAEHLGRHRLADLFLDTLPYNAHTTASDALWAGLPVLTRIGETFAGRVAASLLTAAGLPELITDSSDAYEAMAIDLARSPGELQDIKTKLARNRLVSPLFDTGLFAKHIEAAYTAMYERYCADLQPGHICIAP